MPDVEEKDRRYTKELLCDVINVILGNECPVPVERKWTLIIEYEDGSDAVLTSRPLAVATEIQRKIIELVGADNA